METKTANRAATHFGHCQCCGYVQKLPKGLLSLHGYTVQHGWFSGTCRGAKYLPFELSCDQVKRYVAEAKTALVELEAFQVNLRKPAKTAIAWVSVATANPKGHYYSANHAWEQKTVYAKTNQHGRVRYYFDGGTRWACKTGEAYCHEVVALVEEVDQYGYGDRTLLGVVTACNVAYASRLERDAKNLRNYLVWQTERVASWKVAPLLPVKPKGKDKTAFTPEEGTR